MNQSNEIRERAFNEFAEKMIAANDVLREISEKMSLVLTRFASACAEGLCAIGWLPHSPCFYARRSEWRRIAECARRAGQFEFAGTIQQALRDRTSAQWLGIEFPFRPEMLHSYARSAKVTLISASRPA